MTQLMGGAEQHIDKGHELAVGVVVSAAKTAPPVVVSAFTLAGHPMQDWVLLATLVYTVLQIILLWPKFRDWNKRRGGGL